LKEWDKLFAGARKAPVIAIVNPASGPGQKADPNYVKLLERAKKEKATLVGYVSTSYGKRPLKDVTADIDRWLSLYDGLQGVFFDEQASGPEKVDYYADLYDHARKKKLDLVITNPGVVCDEKYLSKPATSVPVVLESPWKEGNLGLPKWVGTYGPEHVAALPYQVKKADVMRKIVEEAAKKVGYLYVTDGDGEGRWNKLPAYWDDEVAAVREVNR
jgi:hypothetical protein